MLKSPVNNLFIALFICCVALQGSALQDDLIITGPGDKEILVDENSFDFKVNFENVDVEEIKKVTYDNSYIVSIGGCEIRFWANEPCTNHGTAGHVGDTFGGNHMGIDYLGDQPRSSYFHDQIVSATVVKEDSTDAEGKKSNSKITASAKGMINGGIMWCDVTRQPSSEYPGKAIVEVKVYGNGVTVDPNLVTILRDVYVSTTSTTTTSTTTSKPTTTTTSIPPTTTPLPTTDPCDEVVSEPRYFCNDDGYVEDL